MNGPKNISRFELEGALREAEKDTGGWCVICRLVVRAGHSFLEDFLQEALAEAEREHEAHVSHHKPGPRGRERHGKPLKPGR